MCECTHVSAYLPNERGQRRGRRKYGKRGWRNRTGLSYGWNQIRDPNKGDGSYYKDLGHSESLRPGCAYLSGTVGEPREQWTRSAIAGPLTLLIPGHHSWGKGYSLLGIFWWSPPKSHTVCLLSLYLSHICKQGNKQASKLTASSELFHHPRLFYYSMQEAGDKTPKL